MADDDDEGTFGGLYEGGHWAWDETTNSVIFVSDLAPSLTEVVQIQTKAPTGAIEFRDDVDLIEQVRYRRRYQRKIKTGEPDVVTLQDIKDLAIYTAPINILSPMLINLLHLPTTERFLRALILFCSYYLQITEVVTARIVELSTKVKTSNSDMVETEYRENLSDLRLLVAKEYCILIAGGGETRRFHHMGAQKKRRSLSDKDARLFETFLRISVQIVWLALGRKAFHQIELETNRIFKSEIFNSVEHATKSELLSKMLPEERGVFLGQCVRHDKKLNTKSPLINEIFCEREIDYRLVGLGIVKYSLVTSRLDYFHLAIAGAEHALREKNVILGIIGMSRSFFDTMLRPLPVATVTDKSRASIASASGVSLTKSVGSVKRSQLSGHTKMYPDMVIPKKGHQEIYFPPEFPYETEDIKPVSEVQRRRWQRRLMKLMYPNR